MRGLGFISQSLLSYELTSVGRTHEGNQTLFQGAQ